MSLGGEQNALDPALAGEAELLREATRAGVPVLGVCLGAQLLAHALGGEVRRLPRRMVTWTPLEPLPAADGDPVLGALPRGAAGLHWNEDGFALPAGRDRAAALPGRARSRAFRAGERAWGVQFHPEVDEEALEGWYEDWYEALAQAAVAEEAARAADREHLGGQRALSEAIFGGFGARGGGRPRVGSPTMPERSCRVGDVDIAYETFGDPADPAVLLVMGLGTQMLGWHEDFCARDRRPTAST